MNVGKGVFVAGTDTGVGKTVVSAWIATALKALGWDIGVMKPFQTGASKAENGWFAPDAQFLKDVSGVKDDLSLVCPVILEHPLAPSVAATLVNRSVGIADVLPAFRELSSRHTFMIVESAGGLGVPIAERVTMRDLATAMALPLVIVARPGLGTLNHTLLTVEYARAASLSIAGIVICDYPDAPGLAEQTNPQVMEQLTGVPILGILPHIARLDTETGQAGALVQQTVNSPLIARLIDRLRAINGQ